MEKVKDQDVVLYTTGNRTFGAVVSGEPWALGNGHMVVNLEALGPEYRAYTGVSRTRVNAASVRDLQPAPTEWAEGEWVLPSNNAEPDDAAAVITYTTEPSPETGHVGWCWWALGKMGEAPSYEAARAAAESVVRGFMDSFMGRSKVGASEPPEPDHEHPVIGPGGAT